MKQYAAGIQSSALSLVDDVPVISGDAAVVTGATSSDEKTEPVRAPAAASVDLVPPKATKEPASGQVEQSFRARGIPPARADAAPAKPISLDGRDTALPVAERQRKPTGSARPNRKHLILVAGVLGSVIVIGGLFFALRSESGQAQPQNVAKPAPPVTASGRSMLPGQTANASKPVREEVSSVDFAAKVEELEKAGNWNVLVIYALDWTRKHPGNTDAWKRLSLGYVKLGQLPEALDAATKAVQLAPEDFLLWQNVGHVNLAFQRRPEALLAYQKAAALNDRDVVSLVQEGILNTQLGHLPDARIAFDKALAVSPEDVPALCGAASIAQKEGRVKDADAMARQVTSLDGHCRDSSGSESVRVVSSSQAQSKPSTRSLRAQ